MVAVKIIVTFLLLITISVHTAKGREILAVRVTGDELAVCAPAAAFMFAQCGPLAVGVLDSLIKNGGRITLDLLSKIISPDGKKCLDATIPLVECLARELGDNLSRSGPIILFPIQLCYLKNIGAGVPDQQAWDNCAACCRDMPASCSEGCFPQAVLPPRDDIAFVVDTTGSMSDDIAAVQASISTLLSSLNSNSADYRVALVGYNDPSVTLVSDFTTDSSAFTSAVNSLGASGGGDFPEHVLGGIARAISLDWRIDATRTIIVMGDAPPKDPEPGTGWTSSTIAALANLITLTGPSLEPTVRTVVRSGMNTLVRQSQVSVDIPYPGYIRLMMVAIGSDSETTASFQTLASGGSGQFFSALSADDVVNKLIEAIAVGTGGKPVVLGLKLTSMCWVDADTHRLRVRNDNSFNVDYTWDVYKTTIKGNGIAKPGDNFFNADGLSSSSTVRLFWKNELGQTKSTTKALNTIKC